jgi:hypothetical protein
MVLTRERRAHGKRASETSCENPGSSYGRFDSGPLLNVGPVVPAARLFCLAPFAALFRCSPNVKFEPYAWPLRFVCPNEFHTCLLERPLNFPECFCRPSDFRGAFYAFDGANTDSCPFRKFDLIDAQEGSGRPNLCGFNHFDVDHWQQI